MRRITGRSSCFAQPRKSSRLRPCLRKPHWNWYRLRSLTNGTIALGGASTTRAPQNGGSGDRHVLRSAAGGAACTAATSTGRKARASAWPSVRAGLRALPTRLRLHRRQIVVEPVAGHPVHQMQPVERIARIGDAAAGIGARRSHPRHSCGSARHRRAAPESPGPGATFPPGSRASPRWISPAGRTCRWRARGARCAAASMSASGTLMPRLTTR